MMLTAPSSQATAVTRLLKSLTTSVAAASSADEILEWALDLVCGYTGWPLGHVYRVGDDGMLAPSGIWHDEDPERHRPFVEMTDKKRLAVGVGLPGRIIATGRPVSILDVVSDRNFPRAPAALESGIEAGFGFPIVSERGIEGVMEFFSTKPAEPDAELLELLSHVGIQVGQLLDRARARQLLQTSEARMRSLVEGAPDGLIVVDESATITLVNDETERLTGYRREELLGQPVEMLIPDRLTARHITDRREYARSPRRRAMGAGRDLVLLRCDGTEVPVEISLSPLDGPEGQVVVALRDTAERRLADSERRTVQNELTHQEKVLEQIARGQPLESTLTTICRRIEDRFEGVRCSVLLAGEGVLHHAAAPSLPRSYQEAIDGLPIAEGAAVCGTAAYRGEIVVVADLETDPLTSDFLDLGAEYGIRSIWSHPLKRGTGEVLGTFALYRSEPHRPDAAECAAVGAAASLAALAIERALDEEALGAAANVDSLTDLPNRARFLELVTEALAQSQPRIAVMFLDLDRFKLINDSLGHPVGDRILVEVAARLEQAVESEAVVARFGGDEFTILLDDANPERVERIADRVEEAFIAPFLLDGGEFFLSVSVGIAASDHPADASGLVRDADAAMYAAKERGVGRRGVFDERLRERVLERVTLESELRRALEHDEFSVCYQPVIEVATRRWAGVEALVRWNHPERGLVYPDDFIPVAEEMGLILPLGERILELVAEQAAAVITPGSSMHVAANVSVIQLADPTFPDALAAMLRRHRLSPDTLVLEVTESAVMEELDSVHAALDRLVALGIRVMIDDFGTGYSSIARLGEMNLSGVKVDRTFTDGLGSDPGVDEVLAAITALAHAHGLEVVAEGIETALAWSKVEELDCEYCQGFYLARPVSADGLAEVLAKPVPTPWASRGSNVAE